MPGMVRGTMAHYLLLLYHIIQSIPGSNVLFNEGDTVGRNKRPTYEDSGL